MITEGKAANAIGGKTARACDSCLKKRARCFCSADDAFLCQRCDTLVHSANQLASRHERVRLESSSSAFRTRAKPGDREHVPKWHRGFTRKARTPRSHAKTAKPNNSSSHHSLVPEISGDDDASPFDQNESDEQIRVPVFEPFSHAELCNELNDILNNDEVPEFINASDAELADFAADVESLLGTKIDDGVYGMEAMGYEGEREEEEYELVGSCLDEVWNMEEKSRVKIEDDDRDDHEEVEAVIACHFDPALDMARESLSWDDHFHFSMSPLRPHGEGEEMEEVKVVNHDCSVPTKMDIHESSNDREEKKMMFLKLDYETVITTWGSQGSPWADGIKPEFHAVDFWPDFLNTSPRDIHENPFGAGGGRFGGRDEEREARVMRYREKRRTRLFSKKIRYEVRKLNAEKRPRMKGRFVKRTSFVAQQSFPNNIRNK